MRMSLTNFTTYKQRKKEVGSVKPLILYLTRKIFNISLEHSASSPVDDADALEQVHQLTPTETKQEAGGFQMCVVPTNCK